MQQRPMTLGGRCVVVVLRKAKTDRHGNNLKTFVRAAVLKSKAPDTLCKWVDVSSSDGDTFSAWNIAHPDLLFELLRERKEGRVDFRAYYRFCGGVSTVIPEGGFFEEF